MAGSAVVLFSGRSFHMDFHSGWTCFHSHSLCSSLLPSVLWLFVFLVIRHSDSDEINSESHFDLHKFIFFVLSVQSIRSSVVCMIFFFFF